MAFTSRNIFAIEVCSADTRLAFSSPSTISSGSPFRNFLFIEYLSGGLHHATSMALKFIVEGQCAFATCELSLLVTSGRILCGHLMYKSFIHFTYEVFEVPNLDTPVPSFDFVRVPGGGESGESSTA